MRGFLRFLSKEALEIVRTWRVWVLPGVLLFFAASGPILAKLTPELVKSLTAGQGVSITVPPPTYLDSYAQWVKNLGQLGVFLIIGVSAGLIAGERSSGTAVLVLTKPVSRGSFVVAKYISNAVLLLVATSVGTLLTWGLTAAIFPEAPAGRLLAATGAWIVFVLMLLAVMLLFSGIMSALASVGAGLGVFAGLGFLSLWGPAVRYSPVGLLGAPANLLAGKAQNLAWPLVTGAVAAVLILLAAVAVFRRVEI